MKSITVYAIYTVIINLTYPVYCSLFKKQNILNNRNIKLMYAHYNSFIFQLTVNSKKVSNEKNINCDILLLIIE